MGGVGRVVHRDAGKAVDGAEPPSAVWEGPPTWAAWVIANGDGGASLQEEKRADMWGPTRVSKR